MGRGYSRDNKEEFNISKFIKSVKEDKQQEANKLGDMRSQGTKTIFKEGFYHAQKIVCDHAIM